MKMIANPVPLTRESPYCPMCGTYLLHWTAMAGIDGVKGCDGPGHHRIGVIQLPLRGLGTSPVPEDTHP